MDFPVLKLISLLIDEELWQMSNRSLQPPRTITHEFIIRQSKFTFLLLICLN
ncbi:hypothetical protein Ac2012v2_006724 [Leucoagaricus gongylophorus]